MPSRFHHIDPFFSIDDDDGPRDAWSPGKAASRFDHLATAILASYVSCIVTSAIVTGGIEINWGYFNLFMTSPITGTFFSIARVFTFSCVALLAIIAWLKHDEDWRSGTVWRVIGMLRDACFFIIMAAVAIADITVLADPVASWVFHFSLNGLVLEIPAWIDLCVMFPVTVAIVAKFVAHVKDAMQWHSLENDMHVESGVGKSIITFDAKKFSCVETTRGRICKISKPEK